MFNKADAAKNNDAHRQESMISSPQVKDNLLPLPSLRIQDDTTRNSSFNLAIAACKRLSLSKKATLLAIAISTLPILGIGVIIYRLTSHSLTNSITKAQGIELNALTDKINRFMFERHRDIQVLSNLPILGNLSFRSEKEKQALLDKLIENYKFYSNIYIFNREGKLIAQSSGEALESPQNNSYFQNALKDDTVAIAQPVANNIYIAAPVKNKFTNETIGVVVAQMPVKNIEELTEYDKSINNLNYYLINDSSKIFAATKQADIDKNIQKEFPLDDKLHTTGKVVTQTVINPQTKSENLISFTRLEQSPDIPNLNWQVMLSADAATVFAPQRQLFWKIASATALTALITAAIAAWFAKRFTEPILKATAKVAKFSQGEQNSHITLKEKDELGVLNANLNHMAVQLETLLKEQEKDIERGQLLTDITLRIRSNLKKEDICITAVREVRQALKADRVFIYELNSDTENGEVIAESVNAIYPKILGVPIDDVCFWERHVDISQNLQVQAIANIYQEPNLKDADTDIKILEKFAVKASLIAPIFYQQQPIALIIAHQCGNPRYWQKIEIDLFQHLAIQISYAFEQAELLEEIEQARAIAEQFSTKEQEEKQALQTQLLNLLKYAEVAASGDLSVRAEVSAGEIGTVADFFNSIVESLREIVMQVKVAASQVNHAIGTNSGAIRQLAQEAQTQAMEVDHTLDAVERMTQAIQAVAQNAQQAAAIVENAALTATKSGQAMDLTVQNILHLRETVSETAKKVKRLGESTQQITRVVALINQISMQTNLLAINAGIEAARAGEEAQGFVVVAEEVGELATRSAAATKEIEDIVDNIQRETSEVVQAMEVGTTQVMEGTSFVEAAKSSLSQILEVSQQIDDLVQSISFATTSGVETSQTVSELMKQIAAISKRTSDSSLQVSESLQETVHISQQLQETVGAFKVS
ncbi:MAG: GAF domain-containing protein [Chlorogloeopsis fritschii C42_A2020_084]|uniref:methyl-accepting chemotaxis protein n=1 Tax=Chlorogloeopsis fritschii TaxID=1124 RepID=UPI001A0AA21C|nr:methyl-accepting chemotaxis protein [Chlorogloeopsis fritschii]MBF2008905.1 GAF domain-containing protein [Chlorogloeopsis fritschii C42_A2020_084]